MPLIADDRYLQWIEIDRKALASNLKSFRTLVGPSRRLLAVVKSNAYGHGMIEISRLALAGGADWLGVHGAEEGTVLREAGIEAPILVLGATASGRIGGAVQNGLRLTVYDRDTASAISRAAVRSGIPARIHLKVETGTNRQGVRIEGLVGLVRSVARLPGSKSKGSLPILPISRIRLRSIIRSGNSTFSKTR